MIYNASDCEIDNIGYCNIQITVLVITYNHVNYIRRALDGIIGQKFGKKYEIIIHDDASNDGTIDILKEYERKYPKLITLILQDENQFSKEYNMLGIRRYYNLIRGKYIALCEGDDYWCDQYKLFKQYNALEKNPGIDICGTASMLEYEDGSQKCYLGGGQTERIISTREVISGGAGLVQTATLFFRRFIYCGDYPIYRKNYDIDFLIQIQGALKGGMYYFPDITSVYINWLHPDSWCSNALSGVKKFRQMIGPLYESLWYVNEETNQAYKNEIFHQIIGYKIQEYELAGNIKDIYSDRWLKGHLTLVGWVQVYFRVRRKVIAL